MEQEKKHGWFLADRFEGPFEGEPLEKLYLLLARLLGGADRPILLWAEIVTQTPSPLIGNYGINRMIWSPLPPTCAYIQPVRVAMNIDEYLKQQNIVAISGIDTRHLTKKLPGIRCDERRDH